MWKDFTDVLWFEIKNQLEVCPQDIMFPPDALGPTIPYVPTRQPTTDPPTFRTRPPIPRRSLRDLLGAGAGAGAGLEGAGVAASATALSARRQAAGARGGAGNATVRDILRDKELAKQLPQLAGQYGYLRNERRVGCEKLRLQLSRISNFGTELHNVFFGLYDTISARALLAQQLKLAVGRQGVWGEVLANVSGLLGPLTVTQIKQGQLTQAAATTLLKRQLSNLRDVQLEERAMSELDRAPPHHGRLCAALLYKAPVDARAVDGKLAVCSDMTLLTRGAQLAGNSYVGMITHAAGVIAGAVEAASSLLLQRKSSGMEGRLAKIEFEVALDLARLVNGSEGDRSASFALWPCRGALCNAPALLNCWEGLELQAVEGYFVDASGAALGPPAASSSRIVSLTLSAEAPAVKFSVDGPRVAYFALEQPFSMPFIYKLSDETGCHSAGERSVAAAHLRAQQLAGRLCGHRAAVPVCALAYQAQCRP